MSVLDQFSLRDGTAIVTGGNRGIGKEIARGLADAGANVVIANRAADSGQRAAEEIEAETGREALAVPTDVTVEQDVRELVDTATTEFGSLDVLVNNAGVAFHKPAEEKSLEEWQTTLDINLTGAFFCAKYAAREMMNSDGGSIINLSSMSAFIANYPQKHADYQASKAGLEGLKTQLASEWAEYGIRVNNINPGYVDTEILSDDPEERQVWKDEMVQEEFAAPSDIAPLAVYLASDASSYVTGESIVIDGGYTVR